MDNKQLSNLMKLCRKHGVKSLKTADIELHFDLDRAPQKPFKEALISESNTVEELPLSDEEILLWSSNS